MNSVANLDPGSGEFLSLDPGSGMGKKSAGMNNQDHISESSEKKFGLKYLNSLMWIWDGKNSDAGSRINFPDP